MGRDDHPSFYDPEHPANQSPTIDEHFYTASVLCDDGEVCAWEGWASDNDDAKDRAWNRAIECGLSPTEIESCARAS